jgi:hypothetical protein
MIRMAITQAKIGRSMKIRDIARHDPRVLGWDDWAGGAWMRCGALAETGLTVSFGRRLPVPCVMILSPG